MTFGERQLLFATASTLRALLTHSVDAELTERERLAYKAVMDEALRPFGPSGEPPVEQDQR